MTTDIFALPEIQESQASKHVTHNEALRQLEALLARVASRAAPEPGSPSSGDVYIVPGGASGAAWSGHDDEIAHFYGGAWHFYPPIPGLSVWVVDEARPVRYVTGQGWVEDLARPRLPTRSVSANYTVQTADEGHVLLVDTSGGPVTVSLPAASSRGGLTVAIVKASSDGNAVTVSPDGSDTVRWQSSTQIAAQGDGTLIVSDGAANWVAVGGGGSAGGGGTSLPLLDNQALFADSDDDTKRLAFELGGFTTATTRTVTWPNKSGTVAMLADVTGGGGSFTAFDEDGGTTSGLTWGYQAGSVRSDAGIVDVPAGTVTLADNATNYVEVDATGSVSVNQTGFTDGRIPIREVATSSGSQTASTDKRALMVGGQVFYAGLTAALPCNRQPVTAPQLRDHSETSPTPAPAAGTLDVDVSAGSVAEVTLDQDVTTLNLNNPAPSGQASSLTLVLVQDGTGGRSITWPSSIAWAGGAAPTLTGTANSVDIVTLFTRDGGTTWFAFTAGQDMQ
ncbi:DUF2793 domain-containing protein [Ectothiorhodospiraceae bacterium WFHF3C12]|nr:DUF2793 domain-containing protein [Ectothiorhodospiraceae bacterium WFHF3C12]